MQLNNKAVGRSAALEAILVRMVEIHLRAPIEIVVDREGIELAALVGWEEYEALPADELHMQVGLEFQLIWICMEILELRQKL